MGLDHILQSMRTCWPEAVSAQSTCVLAVLRFATLLQTNARAALTPYGLSFFEFEVLSALRASSRPHEMVPSELYDAILISSGGLTKVLRSLEERGFIVRIARPGDRRRRPIALTAKGRGMAEKAMTSVQQADERKLHTTCLTEADYEQLASLITRALQGYERKS